MANSNFVSIPKAGNEEERIQEDKIILLWSISVCLVVLNTTMFNVALPSILRDLSLSSRNATWFVSGYSIVFAISTLTYSRLSDHLPISRLMLIGAVLLGSTSLLGFIVHDYYALLLTRILQAAGAGAVPGLGMVLTGKYIPLMRRGKAMASIASAASLGFGLGPVIGGAITQYFGWNYLFLITGFILFFIPMFLKLLPKERSTAVKFDVAGGILTGISVMGVLLFLSTYSFVVFISTIVVIRTLWRHLHRVKIPFIQPELIRNKQYVKLILIAFSSYFTHFATLFLMPIILTSFFHKEPAEVGLLIFPGAILSALCARSIGKMIDHVGNRPLIHLSISAILLSTILFAFLAYHSPIYILGAYMFMSVGFSGLNSSISNETTRILTKEKLGAGLGLAQLVQFFGGGFGVTIAGGLLSLQKGVATELIYRNVFFALTLIVICSATTAISYFNKKLKCIVSQNP